MEHKHDEYPNPFEEILRWTREHRRDVLPYLDEIIRNIREGQLSEREHAIRCFMSIAFTAGRDCEGRRQAGEREDLQRRATRWKNLSQRLFRERVPLGRVAHEIGNGLQPVLVTLNRMKQGKGDAQDLVQRAADGVERVLAFGWALRNRDAHARVGRRS